MKNWTYVQIPANTTNLQTNLKNFEKNLNDNLQKSFSNIELSALDIFAAGYAANLLVQSNASLKLASVSNLGNFIKGTTYQIEITAYTSAGTAQVGFPAEVHIGNSTSYTKIESDGTIEFVGDAKIWRDEIGDALTLQITGPGVSFDTTDLVVSFSTQCNLADFAYKNVQLNHDRDLAGVIYPHLHIFQFSSNIPNMILQYRYQINGLVKATSWNNLKCNTAVFAYTAGTTITQILYSTQGITPTTESQLSDIIQFRIIRDTTNATGEFSTTDPSTAAIGITSFDAHVLINTIASRTEYTK